MSKMMSLFFRYYWVRSQTNRCPVLAVMSLRVMPLFMKRLLAGTMEGFSRELSLVKNNNKVIYS